jgi:hypothetical protein
MLEAMAPYKQVEIIITIIGNIENRP